MKKFVILEEGDWSRLPIKIGAGLAEHLRRFGFKLASEDGQDVDRDNRLDDFLVGLIAAILKETS